MNRIRSRVTPILLCAVALAIPAIAEHHEGENAEMPELTGYLADFQNDFEFSNDRILQLAEAIPAEMYGWRPSVGIRSVSETIVHVAGANFFFANQFGIDMPEGFGMDAEKTVTAKEDVVALLEQSMKHIRMAAHNAAEKNLDETVMMFGRDRSWRAVLMIVSGHGHEHLGQTIAYARSIGIVPPWSQPQPAADEGGNG